MFTATPLRFTPLRVAPNGQHEAQVSVQAELGRCFRYTAATRITFKERT